MAKILFVIAQQDFRDEELFEPKKICEGAGIECTVASITTNEAVGKLGATVTPDIAVKDARPEDYDMLAIVGGPGSPTLAEYPEVLNLVQFFSKNKKLAAICYGPTVLARASVLNGKKVTFFKDKFSDPIIRQAGGIVTDQSVVTDGNLTTACGPQCATAFGRALVDLLSN
ncbi:MAG: DJ-1/PfpI family protein [Patescibacteria group bacterium]